MTILEARRICTEYYYKTNPSEEDSFLYTEALKFLIEEAKDADYMVELGGLYYESRQFDLALKYYELAAEYNNLYAISNLGYIWYYGRTGERNYEKAFYYFDKARQMGDIIAAYKVADMYKNGYYVEQNEQHAIHLYFAAMNVCMSDDYHGDAIADIDLRLGTAFLHSDVLEHDASNALFHLNRALTLFYQRRKVDPFVKGLIQSTKELIAEATAELDEEVI